LNKNDNVVPLPQLPIAANLFYDLDWLGSINETLRQVNSERSHKSAGQINKVTQEQQAQASPTSTICYSNWQKPLNFGNTVTALLWHMGAEQNKKWETRNLLRYK
jgi:hypothetical protein